MLLRISRWNGEESTLLFYIGDCGGGGGDEGTLFVLFAGFILMITCGLATCCIRDILFFVNKYAIVGAVMHGYNLYSAGKNGWAVHQDGLEVKPLAIPVCQSCVGGILVTIDLTIGAISGVLPMIIISHFKPAFAENYVYVVVTFFVAFMVGTTIAQYAVYSLLCLPFYHLLSPADFS